MKIRTVKPEFWQSEKLATRISRDARLLFIGLLCMADDHGRFRAHPNLIRGEVFPYEPDADVVSWLRELVDLGIVRLYQHGGSQYGVVSNFAEHQKIDKRWASRLPAPPPENSPPTPPAPGESPPVSTEPHQSLAEQPARLTEQPASLANSTPTDRIGSERIGTEPPQTRACAREGSAAPERPPSRRGPRLAHPPDPEVVELQQALLATPFRNQTKPKDREFVVLAFAVEVFPTGLRAAHVPRLFELDEQSPNRKGPIGSLFATWLKRNMWREVLDEDANRRKEAGASARADRAADPYAGDTPRPAASVVGDVLARAKAGGA